MKICPEKCLGFQRKSTWNNTGERERGIERGAAARMFRQPLDLVTVSADVEVSPSLALSMAYPTYPPKK